MFNLNYPDIFILSIIDSLLFVFLFKFFINDKRRNKLLDIVFTIILTNLIMYTTIFNITIYIKLIVISVIMFIYTLFYNIKTEYRFIIILLYYLITIFVESFLTMLLMNLLHINPINNNSNLYGSMFLFGLSNKLMIFLIFILIIKIFKPKKIILPKNINLALIGNLVFSIISILLLINLILNINKNINNIFFFIYFSLLGINLGAFYFYFNLKKFYMKLENQETKKIYNKLNEKHLSKRKVQDKLLSEIWHDMNNHIKTLELMMFSDAKEGPLKYITSIQDKFKEIPNKIKTGNIITDIILNEKLSEASLYGINSNVKAAMPPKSSINKADLSSILFNTLDNAIEANLITTMQNKYIHIDLYPEGDYLYYKIKNSYDPNIKNTRSKSLFNKKTYIQPGYGLSIINNIVDKYNGYIEFDKTNNEFTVTLFIPL